MSVRRQIHAVDDDEESGGGGDDLVLSNCLVRLRIERNAWRAYVVLVTAVWRRQQVETCDENQLAFMAVAYSVVAWSRTTRVWISRCAISNAECD